MQPETISKISQHYEHAKEKHPYFCDALDRHTLSICTTRENALLFTENCLRQIRAILAGQMENGRLNALTVLDCEVQEIEHAVIREEFDHAVEECYDAIAVLLRVVDVLEWRQALGKPVEIEEIIADRREEQKKGGAK